MVFAIGSHFTQAMRTSVFQNIDWSEPILTANTVTWPFVSKHFLDLCEINIVHMEINSNLREICMAYNSFKLHKHC